MQVDPTAGSARNKDDEPVSPLQQSFWSSLDHCLKRMAWGIMPKVTNKQTFRILWLREEFFMPMPSFKSIFLMVNQSLNFYGACYTLSGFFCGPKDELFTSRWKQLDGWPCLEDLHHIPKLVRPSFGSLNVLTCDLHATKMRTPWWPRSDLSKMAHTQPVVDLWPDSHLTKGMSSFTITRIWWVVSANSNQHASFYQGKPADCMESLTCKTCSSWMSLRWTILLYFVDSSAIPLTSLECINSGDEKHF